MKKSSNTLQAPKTGGLQKKGFRQVFSAIIKGSMKDLPHLEGPLMKKAMCILLALFLLTGCAAAFEKEPPDASLEALEEAHALLQVKYDGLRKRVGEQDAQLDEDQETIQRLTQELEDLQETLAASTQENEEMAQALLQLQAELDACIQSMPVGDPAVLTEEDIDTLLYLKRADVLDYLGPAYDEALLADGVEGYDYGHFALVFGYDDGLELIISDSLSLSRGDLNVGMTVSAVLNLMGETDIREVEQVVPDDPVYVLLYDWGTYRIWLGADHNMRITMIQVRFF